MVDAETLYQEYGARVLLIASRLCQRREDAEDVSQDTFLEVIRRVHQFRGTGPVEAWLCSIAKAKALMLLRRERYRATSPLIEGVMPARQDLIHERLDLECAVAQLTRESRQALVYHEMDGYTMREIANRTGTSLTCTKARVRRARARVRQFLGLEN
jgi:RNA polymerase sigma-70 factor, ECF subfamily